MKRILFFVLAVVLACSQDVYARTFPSNGKRIHYQFSKQEIRFEGRKSLDDKGLLRCYDLRSDSMWAVGRPWGSAKTEWKGLPLDCNYVFDYDISSKKLGPKLTLILEMKVEKNGDEAEGPIWLCSHKDAEKTGYYPFGTDQDHYLIFKGKAGANDSSALTQYFRLSGKPDTYSTFILLIDRTSGKHTFYTSDTAIYYYMDEALLSAGDFDRLVFRQCKKGGIREIALYNRLLTTKEIETFYWGSTISSHPPIKEAVAIVDNSEQFASSEIAGVKGWTPKDVYAVVFCIALAVVSIVLNLFVRKKPIGYRGKGWVVVVLLLSLLVAQLFTHSPFQAGHVYMIVGIVCYIIVAFGPVPFGYMSSPLTEFWGSIRGAFRLSFNFLGRATERSMAAGSAEDSRGSTTKTVVSRYDQSGRYMGSHTNRSSNVGGGFVGPLIVFALYVGVALMIISIISQAAYIFIPFIILVRFVLNLWRKTF